LEDFGPLRLICAGSWVSYTGLPLLHKKSFRYRWLSGSLGSTEVGDPAEVAPVI
jgi:hypothetical protein